MSNTIPQKIGRYIVQETLGKGAMGTVYLATDPVIDRAVAIKLIQSTARWTPEEQEHYRARFSREAKAAGRLLHPAIVTVFDAGETEDGLPYLVMEYVKGKTLKNLIGAEELSLEQILQMGREILEGLDCAHSQGVVHRDLKPANIIITDDFHAKIMDFGIAHLAGSDLTQTGEMIGTPHFMAPEQIDGKPVDLRTDLFAFGIVFYLMLTGEQPFVGDTFTSLTYAIVNKDPIPPEQIKAEIPESLSRVVLRCIHKNPDERYSNAREVVKELNAAHPSPVEAMSDTMRRSRTQQPTPVRRSVWPKIALFAVALLVPLAFYLRYMNGPAELPAAGSDTPVATAPQSSAQAFPETKQEAASFADAEKAFESGNMDESKATLEAILAKDPSHAEARELLERVTNHQLFSESTIALRNEEWEKASTAINTLLQNDPEFPGAREVREQLMDRQFSQRLPLSFPARHNHTFGGCNGTLAFGKHSITYKSEDHGRLNWTFSQIIDMEWTATKEMEIVTTEKGNKKYKFSFPNAFLRTDDWQRYQKLWSKK